MKDFDVLKTRIDLNKIRHHMDKIDARLDKIDIMLITLQNANKMKMTTIELGGTLK